MVSSTWIESLDLNSSRISKVSSTWNEFCDLNPATVGSRKSQDHQECITFWSMQRMLAQKELKRHRLAQMAVHHFSWWPSQQCLFTFFPILTDALTVFFSKKKTKIRYFVKKISVLGRFRLLRVRSDAKLIEEDFSTKYDPPAPQKLPKKTKSLFCLGICENIIWEHQ